MEVFVGVSSHAFTKAKTTFRSSHDAVASGNRDGGEFILCSCSEVPCLPIAETINLVPLPSYHCFLSHFLPT